MTIKTNTRTVNIQLCKWESGNGYGPDCFQDLEVNFPAAHQRLDGSDEIVCTDSELDELIAWWQSECDAANSGKDGDILSPSDLSDGDEWCLIAD